jgi:hypothetical protein
VVQYPIQDKYSKEKQEALYKDTERLWKEHRQTPDLMLSCVRFGIPPREISKMISLALCWTKYEEYQIQELESPSGSVLLMFMKRLQVMDDAWSIPPVMRCGGVSLVHKFLTIFGDRNYFVEQLQPEDPCSLRALMLEVLGCLALRSFMETFKKYRFSGWITIPPLLKFMDCLGTINGKGQGNSRGGKRPGSK